MTLSGTFLPRRTLRPGNVDPLIEEARERGRRRRRRNAAFLLALIVVGVTVFSVDRWTGDGQAGVSVSRLAAATGPIPNPCTLLTNAEAAGAFGRKVLVKIPRSSQGMHACQWEFQPLGNFMQTKPSVMVLLGRTTKGSFERAEKQRSGVRVGEIGELAYWHGNGGAVQMLDVWAGGYSLTVFPSTVEAPLRIAKLIAADVLRRL